MPFMLSAFQSTAKEFWRDEDGQALIEYGLMINLITLTILLTMSIMGRKVSNVFNKVANAIHT